MRSYRDTASHSSVGPCSPQMQTIPVQEMKRACARLTQVDQMSSPPQLREIQKAGKLLAQPFEVREIKIVALRRDVERGHYSIEAERVAEKIMKDLLVDLCHERAGRWTSKVSPSGVSRC